MYIYIYIYKERERERESNYITHTCTHARTHARTHTFTEDRFQEMILPYYSEVKHSTFLILYNKNMIYIYDIIYV